MMQKLSARASLLAGIALFCVGCSTLPTLSNTTPVADSRRFAHQTTANDSAAVTIVRDSSFAGSAVNYRLLIDGTVAAHVGTGEFIVLYVAPGERVIEVRHPSALFGSIGDSATLRAEAAGRYFYRVNSDVGQIRLLRTTEESIKGGG